MPKIQPQWHPLLPSLSLNPFFIALLLASVTALCTAAPALYEPLWPLAWIAFIPLFLALRMVSPRQALVIAWWTESLMYWVGFYWLIGTMTDFGFIPLPLSVLFFLIIGLGNGIRLGFFAWWLRSLAMHTMPWWFHLCLPACLYVTFDYLFPRVFPWYLGFLQSSAPLFIQIADVTGVHGVTFIIVVCNTVGAALCSTPPRLSRTNRNLLSVGCGVLLLVQIGYGLWRIPHINAAMQQATTLRLGLIQPNIGMYEKNQRTGRNERLELQVSMSQAMSKRQPDLIIWPESMYPYTVPTQLQTLPGIGYQQSYGLLGALTYTQQGTERLVFNSALLVDPDGQILGRYDKQALLAFGEYIPFQRYFPFLRHISPTIGNLTPGQGGVVTLPNGLSIGPLICYEDIIPELARRAVHQGAQLLVNLTNDVWFGRTRAPYQHRSLATFRAVENRVYLVRVTNTGVTSVIDAIGRERAILPIFQRDTLVHDIQPLRLDTFYTRFGDWFARLCCLAALCGSVWCWYRKRKS